MSNGVSTAMQQELNRLHYEREQVEKAPPFQKAEAAGRMFDVMVDVLESIDARLTYLENRL